MNRLKDKLRSGKGASITFALLLFLVCAVLCSVIITSAAATSGRLSNMAQSDQRYYSVTSACDLLKDLISDKTVTIVDVTPEGGSASYYVLEGVTNGEAIANYSRYSPIGATYTPDSVVTDIASRYYGLLTGKPSISLSGPVSGTEAAVDTVIRPSKGEMIVTVSKYSSDSTHPFVMEILFKADASEKTSTKQLDNDNGTSSTVNIRARSITWSMESMKIN